MARVRIEDVHKRFGANHVLKGIDLELDDGEFLVLVGPSGCGKSTLLNLIAGLETISSGRIIIGDRVVNAVHPKDRNIAMVFQSYALYPTKTVRDNVTFGLKTRGVPKARQEEALKSVTELLHIDELLDRKPGQLSGGQRQRVAMGRALVRNPDVFLFDEPLSNLDAKLRIEMRTEIKKLHQRLGKTIVYVTHDQIEAMTLASRIAVMDDGHIRQFADPDTIYNEPDDLFVAGFMGSPPMNILPGRLIDGGGLAVEVAMEGAEPTRFPITERLCERAKAHVGSDIILGLRPETITAAAADGQDGKHFIFERNIEVVEPTGPDTLLIFDLGGIEATARVHPAEAAPPNTLYRFAVDMDQAKLFDASSGQHIRRAIVSGQTSSSSVRHPNPSRA